MLKYDENKLCHKLLITCHMTRISSDDALQRERETEMKSFFFVDFNENYPEHILFHTL